MREDRLAAEYVAVVDDVRKVAQALAEGRWRDGVRAALDLAASAEYLAEAASAAGGAGASPTMLRGHVIQQVNVGGGDRGVLEALDPGLAGVDPGRGYEGLGLPPQVVAGLPPMP
ncbi:hypothetical protein [Actinomadura rugatobispora]|uniref:DUF222 domain-containing protein n=1 Tax=Actinomadura rugatobispora TaxID=1994 RepID=A0ABW0ZTG1_9ACTN|nr:hypothetical protein GCM10010200_089870 [Actinomadura rugatobispora]